MKNIIIVSEDEHKTRQCLSRLHFDSHANDGNGGKLIFHRKVRYKPPCDYDRHHLDNLKEVPSGYNEASNMEYEDCDSTMQSSGEYSSKRKHSTHESQRMKYLKAGAEPSPSYCNGELSSSEVEFSGNMKTQEIEQYVNLYLLNTNNASVFNKTVADKCIPNGLWIVPVSNFSDFTDKFDEKDETAICSILEDKVNGNTTKSHKQKTRLLIVECLSDKDSTIEKERVETSHMNEKCSIDELSGTVYKLLSEIADNQCSDQYDDFQANQSLFVPEENFNGNQKYILNNLLMNKNIFRFEESKNKKAYICCHPCQLLNMFENTLSNLDFNLKVEKGKFLKAMMVQRDYYILVLEALAALNLIQFDSKNVYIKDLTHIQKFDLSDNDIEQKMNVLRLSTSENIQISEFIVECGKLGWDVKRTRHEIVGCNSIDMFLIEKDKFNVLMWFDIFDGTSVFIHLLKNEINDIERDYCHYLRCGLKHCMGDKVNVSICKKYQREHGDSRGIKALIHDTIEDERCEWIDSKDPKLHYIEDAIELLKHWISPSQENETTRTINNQLNDIAIGSLCSIFGKGSKLFFIEQGIEGAEIDHIEDDYRGDSKRQISKLLSIWKKLKNGQGNLFCLRKAIKTSNHHPVSLDRFDEVCAELLRTRSLQSLI
ncbi:hypothetical protein ACF0H5_005957 [Mactra antiquata]